MSKFCENCGAELQDTDKTCPNCGAAVAEATKDVKNETVNTTNTEKTATAEKKPMDKKNMAIIGGIAGAAVLVLIIILAIVFGGGNYKSPINNFFNGMTKGNSNTFLKALPKAIVKEEDLKDTYDKDAMKDIKETLEDKYGKNVKITYKIKEKEKIDKDDIKDLSEEFQDEYGKSGTKITAGYELTLDVKIKGKDDHTKLDDVKMNVYKIGGKWCLLTPPSFMSKLVK